MGYGSTWRRGAHLLLVLCGMLTVAAMLAMTTMSASPIGAQLDATVVVQERGGAAGNGGDASPLTYAFAADNRTVQLVRLDQSAIARSAVPDVYGTAGGMRIYAGGQDVASPSYAALSGPLQPTGLDLSAANWQQVSVPRGKVAIDPVVGRFLFNGGGSTPSQVGGVVPNAGAGGQAHNAVFVQDGYAYVTDWTHGLYIYDISNPQTPSLVGRFERIQGVTDGTMDVVVDGNYAYVAFKWHGLRVLDISNRANPIEVAGVRPFGADQLSLHLYKSGRYIYQADEGNGVLMYDVLTPTNPTYVGRYHTPSMFAQSVHVHGQRVYVAEVNGGVTIWNVSSVGSSSRIGAIEGGDIGTVWGVHVEGDYAYLAASNRLHVVNVSNPANPRLLGSAATIGQAYAVTVRGGYAVVGQRGSTGYVQVFDVQDPTTPVLVRTFSDNKTGSGGISGVCVANGLVYAAANNRGLLIVDPNLSQAPRGAVTVDYNWLQSITPPTPTPTLDPSTTVTITVQVERQGRGTAPSDRWIEPLWVQVAEPNGGRVLYTYEVMSDAHGRAVVAGVPQGVYDLYVRGRTSLYNVARARTLTADVAPIHVGLLAEGDANLDGQIDILDFSLLASSYGLATGQAGYEPRADFDGDGAVGLLDFSLLASNYGMSGPLNAPR
jgi:hypothetical protein